MKNKIRDYRQKLNMTQQELADTVFVSSRTVISLEQGKYNPSLLLAYRIALLFHTSIEELYCLKENMENIEIVENIKNVELER